MKRYQTETLITNRRFTIFKALDNYSTVLCQNIHPLHDMNSEELKGSFTLRRQQHEFYIFPARKHSCTCLSICSKGVSDLGGLVPGEGRHYSPPITTKAGGTHPTGILSCYFNTTAWCHDTQFLHKLPLSLVYPFATAAEVALVVGR